ncbi:MAG: glutathione S-transferase family protein [Pseudomonadota bacterium]
MTQIILHNYPKSPVAEKARVALGMKGLAWHSVEIPRLAPKPNLTKLTGGYRRTPVMQIGADIYCDSAVVIDELERRFPHPTFYPTTDTGLARLLSRWTDGPMFDLAVKIVLGSAGDALPADFAKDRGRLYFGADWAAGLKAAGDALPHLAAQIRGQLGWINDQLSYGRAFLLGDAPGAIDAQIYHIVWFLRGRWAQGPQFLSEFPALEAWEARVAQIGHGTVSNMTPEAAIEAARMDIVTEETADHHDPQGLRPGMRVTVSPDLDGGEQPVEGRVHAVSATRMALLREDADLGQICVHFPRVGYRIDAGNG